MRILNIYERKEGKKERSGRGRNLCKWEIWLTALFLGLVRACKMVLPSVTGQSGGRNII